MDAPLAGVRGIHPDKDVTRITIPPPQMVANMKVGKMDGFCVGEPWNARAIADGIGFTAITTQQMWQEFLEGRSCMLLPKKMPPRTSRSTAIISSLRGALLVY